jgi:Short C-terminal domain
MRAMIAAALLAGLGGCVLPSTKQGVSNAPMGGDISVSKCDIKVGFSGAPRALDSAELATATAYLPKFSKWSIEGWVLDQYRLLETVTCLCRDYPFAPNEVREIVNAARNTALTKNALVSETSAGIVIDYEGPDSSPSAREHYRHIYPATRPSCFAVARVRAPEATAIESRASFFSRLTLSPANAPSALSVAERLRQLDKLLADGLITREEYAERRRVVLEQL